MPGRILPASTAVCAAMMRKAELFVCAFSCCIVLTQSVRAQILPRMSFHRDTGSDWGDALSPRTPIGRSRPRQPSSPPPEWSKVRTKQRITVCCSHHGVWTTQCASVCLLCSTGWPTQWVIKYRILQEPCSSYLSIIGT